jgi:MerR family transcriptional regulator, thiopeptide resistance regulator
MVDSFDIAEVSRRTGLSSRALRFYEARGLVKPLRSASGRRYFDAAELERLHQIIVLKATGLSLAQMQKLFSGKNFNLPLMLSAHLQLLDEEKQRIEQSRSIIAFTLSRINCGEPVNAETLCALIESGDKMMQQEPKEWRDVTERYFSPAEKILWAEAWTQMGAEWDPESYSGEWKKLGDEIAAAMPMDANSELAQSFVTRWFQLLAPFAKVATPDMWNGAVAMYEDMDNWSGEGMGAADPGFTKEVWDFMKQATAARLASGAMLEPLAPMVWGEQAKEGEAE